MLRPSRLYHASKYLLLLLQALFVFVAIAFAQADSLTINGSLALTTTNLSSSTFELPEPSTAFLTVSVALCGAAPASGDATRFFVTNNTAVSNPGPDSTQDGVYEITVESAGVGSVVLDMTGGAGVFAVDAGGAAQSFEVGVSDTSEPLYEVLTSLPLLGDTTANQALLFSPPFLAPSAATEPSYPNYTLPIASLPVPTPPTQHPNFTLIAGPVNVFPEFDFSTNTFVDGTPVTACALGSLSNLTVMSGSFGSVQESLVLRDSDGWRFQWLVDGLQPLTNYTTFVLQDGVKVAGPVNFVTKSALFACPLVHSLPYCPLVSYAVPLPSPSGPPGTQAYDASSLPESVSGPLISYMTNFTTSLLSFACGRDLYSPLVSCADCQAAYRTWLCAVQLPRCGDSATASVTTSSAGSTSTPSSPAKVKLKRSDSGAQAPFIAPALLSQNSSATRNTNLPAFPGGNWTELLPCLEVCNAAERACPFFVGFACPLPRFNAQESYGVGYVDGDARGGDWEKLGGVTGKAQDRWGNVWCNGPGLVG
ncbi:hypothetical protein M0805_009624 [Coniferiporia weirii]|nr:hypothetical protein M0805_009624 [Coniferiporia weirii]